MSQKPLLTQLDYYASEIDRLTAERDEWKGKYLRIIVAGEGFFRELREALTGPTPVGCMLDLSTDEIEFLEGLARTEGRSVQALIRGMIGLG